jgi:hypothetical protein
MLPPQHSAANPHSDCETMLDSCSLWGGRLRPAKIHSENDGEKLVVALALLKIHHPSDQPVPVVAMAMALFVVQLVMFANSPSAAAEL